MYKVYNNGMIKMVRGDTVIFKVRIIDSNDTDYELQEGDMVTFTVKQRSADITPLIQKHGDLIKIDPEDTSCLPFGRYFYDVQLTFADGTVDTIIPKNVFEIAEEIT